MAGRGGYQAPDNPAPVSGPGELSQRTDGQGAMALPDAKYGEQADFQALQGAAPMEALTSLDAPTARPAEPVTSGNPLGPGASRGPADSIRREEYERMSNFLPVLTFLASQPGSSPSTRQLVRQLYASKEYYSGG